MSNKIITLENLQDYDARIKGALAKPAGVYDTVAALTTAYPSGNGNVYVVRADNKWYSWSGSAWVAGGDYEGLIDVVPNSRKVAGLSLEGDITKEALLNSLKAQHDSGTEISSSNYQTLGISSIENIPNNTNWYIFGNVTEQMVSGLPKYGGDGIYLSKFSIANGAGWWAIAVEWKTANSDKKIWFCHNNGTANHSPWTSVLNDSALDILLKTRNGIVQASNYQALGITSVLDIPINTVYIFTRDIDSQMISDMPIYGETVSIIRLKTGSYAGQDFSLFMAFGVGGKMWVMNYNADTTWQRIDFSDKANNYQHDSGLELRPDNYSSLGITSLATIPVNTNWYIFGTITSSQVSGLPYYGTSINDGIYLSKFGCVGGIAYWAVAIHYPSNRTWVCHNGGTWQELALSGSGGGGGYLPYQSENIGFTVPINQNDYNTDSESNTVQDSETISNVGCVLQLPTTYTPDGTPTKLCLTPHGSGGYVNGNTWSDANKQWLRNNGYALLDVNGSTAYSDEASPKGDCYGSPRAVMALHKAYEWAVKNYNLEKQVYIFAFSMGGLLSLNFANAFPQLIKCIGLVFPVTDLYNQAWLYPWNTGLKAKLSKEYWFADQTGNTWEANKVIGYNPIGNKSTSDGTDKYNFLPVPIKIWHGKADTVVNYQGSVNLTNALKKGGNICSLRLVDGVGHSTNWENVYSVEVLDWFNRWE